jgi:hypothetical protein
VIPKTNRVRCMGILQSGMCPAAGQCARDIPACQIEVNDYATRVYTGPAPGGGGLSVTEFAGAATILCSELRRLS